MKKRLFTMALSFCMLLTLLPVSAFADDADTVEETEMASIVEAAEPGQPAEAEEAGEQESPAVDENGVVQVSSAEELKQAVESAQAGEETTIRLAGDIVAVESMTVAENKKIVLDMNGKTITAAENFSERVFENYGDLTICGKGTVDVTAARENGYGTVNNFGILVVEDGTYKNLKESTASNFYNRNGGTATFEDVTIYGGGGCIATEVNTTTTIHGGYYENAIYPTIENRGDMLITGGEFISTSCSSCDSRWGYTVRSGVGADTAYLKIEGKSEDSVKVTGVQGGLAVIGGTADVYNGIYETVPCKTHNEGTAFYAGYFAGESYETATTIYGGSFTSCSKTAVLVGNSNPAPDSGAGKESTVMIKGGNFVGGDTAKTAITVQNTDYAIGAANITGGTFSSNVSQYVDPSSSMTKDEDGNWVATPNDAENSVAEVDGKYYRSMGDAIAAVGEGETICVLKDIPDAVGISVPSGKDFTIDFGGHTYTLTGPGAGSPSTESNGFQLLKDSKITFKNGSIKIGQNANNIKRIIQNYADLTLEDMQFYAENQVDGEDYCLSFNNGDILFKGNTSVITTGNDTVAFDVCYWKDGGYTGTSVTFDPDYTGTVNGVIMYDSIDSSKGILTIKGNGTFGKIEASAGSADAAKNGIEIYSGTILNPVPPEYIVPGMKWEGGKIVISEDAVAEINGRGYLTLDEALKAAKAGDTVTLRKDVESKTPITLPAGITLNGGGFTLAYTGNKDGESLTNGAFLTAASGSDGVTIRNITIDAGDRIKYGVQFYCVEGGTLSDVTVNGGAYTSVIVNGATGIKLEDCDLNPAKDAYANIEYAMGNDVSTIPSMTVDNVSFGSGSPAVWVDHSTVESMKEQMGGNPSNQDVLDKIHGTGIKNEGRSDVTVSVELEEGETTDTVVEGNTPSGGGSSSSGDYLIQVDKTTGGKVTVTPGRADKGDTVTITVKPSDGYVLDELVVTDSKGNELKLTEKNDNKFTFEMPGSKVTVEATFVRGTEENVLPFLDVDVDDWFYDAVVYAYENDLMSGTSADTFAPNSQMTRAMIWTVLAANDGVNTSGGAVWYEKGQKWAMDNGVSDGSDPDGSITREQLAVMLWRCAGSPKADMSLASYTDASSVSQWAVEAMAWAVENGLISGMGDGILAPQGNATRAQVATIMMQFVEKI